MEQEKVCWSSSRHVRKSHDETADNQPTVTRNLVNPKKSKRKLKLNTFSQQALREAEQSELGTLQHGFAADFT